MCHVLVPLFSYLANIYGLGGGASCQAVWVAVLRARGRGREADESGNGVGPRQPDWLAVWPGVRMELAKLGDKFGVNGEIRTRHRLSELQDCHMPGGWLVAFLGQT